MYRITFETTNKCNMRCKYCYLEHEKEPLSIEVAMKAVDTFLQSDVDHSSLKVSYIGGEPLLYKKNVIRITEKIKEKMSSMNIPVSFVITTNATLLDDEIVEFFIKENFSVKISLDGEKEDHDINRVMLNGISSYDTIINNLPLLRYYEEKAKKMVQISMVINKATYKNVYKNILNAIELGFRFICPCLETYADWNSEELRIIEEQLIKVIDWTIDAAKNGTYIYLKPLLVEHDKRQLQYDCLYCFPGRNNMHIKTNGDIYACYACQKEEFKLGNVNIGFEQKQYSRFKVHNPEYSTKCLKCSLFSSCCAKECVAVNFERNGNLWKVPDCFCEQAKMYEHLYKYFIEQKKRLSRGTK